MKNLEWVALLFIGLVIGTLLIAPTHAAAQQQAEIQNVQAQAVQAVIRSLLTSDDNNQAFLPLVLR